MMAAPRKKKVVEVVEEVVEVIKEGIKPSTDNKKMYQFKDWAAYHRYKGEKS